MPIERIGDECPFIRCKDRDHDVPMFINLEPGRYKHTCPSCGAVQFFTVPRFTSKSWTGGTRVRTVLGSY